MARALPERARAQTHLEVGSPEAAERGAAGAVHGTAPGSGPGTLAHVPRSGLHQAHPRLRFDGARTRWVKDQLYWFGVEGFLFTSPWVVSESTERQAAVLLLSASGDPFQVTLGGRCISQRAIALAPLTRRGLRAHDLGLVSVNIHAYHPCFPIFSQIPRSSGQPLSREAFRPFDDALLRAYEGRLSHHDAKGLFEALIHVAVDQIEKTPGERPRDERQEQLHALLRVDPDCSLGEIARSLGVSYTSASHLFTKSVGLRLRAYQHWLRCMRAVDGLRSQASLTEIALAAGFADSAHFSRTWQQRMGFSPSYIRDAARVHIIDPALPSEPTPKASQEPRRGRRGS